MNIIRSLYRLFGKSRKLWRQSKCYRVLVTLSIIMITLYLYVYVLTHYWIMFGLRGDVSVCYKDYYKESKYGDNLEMPFYFFQIGDSSALHRIAMRSSVVTTLKKLVRYAIDSCNEYGFKCWLDAGTLLGSHRTNEVFSWDEDGDFGLSKQEYNRFCNVSRSGSFRQLAERNREYDGFDIIVTGDSGIFSRAVDVKSKTYIDFWLYEYDEENKTLSSGYKMNDGTILSFPEEMVFTLQNCRMEGKMAFCPKDQRNYLKKMYNNDDLRPPMIYRPIFKMSVHVLCLVSTLFSFSLIKLLMH